MLKSGIQAQLTAILIISVAFTSCDIVIPPHYGCTNQLADNFDSEATHDDGSCVFDPSLFRGCTDSMAVNYDASALVNNCGCRYANVRKVLVEDYTGHTCGNCPRAAEVLHDLQCQWGDRVVPMAVHVGFFALPESNSDGSYASDFRTPAGNEWNTTFGNSALGLPNGLIDRRQVGGSYPQSYTVWSAQVANLLAAPADALIDMQNTYSEASRTVSTNIDISVVNDLNNGPYNIIVCLTEDSIIDWQKNYDPALPDENIADYVHMHMLRTDLNGTWGDQIGAGNLSGGSVENVSYSLQLDTAWNETQCNVVAFVYRTDNKEVVQAEYRPVIDQP